MNEHKRDTKKRIPGGKVVRRKGMVEEVLIPLITKTETRISLCGWWVKGRHKRHEGGQRQGGSKNENTQKNVRTHTKKNNYSYNYKQKTYT